MPAEQDGSRQEAAVEDEAAAEFLGDRGTELA
jgi:hypothetical protein